MAVKLVAGLLLVKALTASPLPMPSPQLIVKSQSNLFREQPGRQIDLSQVLPTKELFWLNLEEVGVTHRGYFISRSRKQLKRLPPGSLGIFSVHLQKRPIYVGCSSVVM